MAGKRILLVDDTDAKMRRPLSDLERLGASVARAHSPNGALQALESSDIDAVIYHCPRGNDPYGCFQLLDWMQTHGRFMPFALFAGASGPVRVQAETRNVLVCSDSFRDIIEALGRHFRQPQSEWRKAPPHLGRRELSDVRKLVPFDPAADTVADGSLDPASGDRWTRFWAARLPPLFDVLRASGAATAELHTGLAALVSDLAEGVVELVDHQRRDLWHHLQGLRPYLLTGRQGPREAQFKDNRVASLLVLPLYATNPLQRPLILLTSPRPYAFGARQMEWLGMVALSWGASQSDAEPRAGHPFADLERASHSQQGACLLRTALRLEALARRQVAFGTSSHLRACRTLLEYTEAILCLPREKWETNLPILPRMMSLKGALPDPSISEASKRDGGAIAALRFAAAASELAFDIRRPERVAAVRQCLRDFERLAPDQQRVLGGLIHHELERTRGAASVAKALDLLGPLWPEKALGSPLPVGRRPREFVCVAGHSSSDGVAAALGRALAAAGFGLVTGTGYPFDEQLSHAYLARLHTWGVSSKEWLVRIAEPGDPVIRRYREDEAHVIFAETPLEALRERLQHARAVVISGGAERSRQLGEAALRSHTLLVPLARTSRAAAGLVERLIPSLPGVSRTLLQIASDHPYGAVISLSDFIRGELAYSGVAQSRQPTRAEVTANVVRVRAGVTTRTGVVLANPHVVVTSGLTERAAPPVIEDAKGRSHRTSLVFSFPSTNDAIVAYAVPDSLNAEGLECRVGKPRPAETVRIVRRNQESSPKRISGTLRLSTKATKFDSDVLRELWSLEADKPFNTWWGAPALDETGRVRALVAGAGVLDHYSREVKLIPASEWYRRVVVYAATAGLEPSLSPLVRSPPRAAKKSGGKKKNIKKR